MISLEQRGVLANKFKSKFRRRPPWQVDWSTEPDYPPDATIGSMRGDPVRGASG